MNKETIKYLVFLSYIADKTSLKKYFLSFSSAFPPGMWRSAEKTSKIPVECGHGYKSGFHSDFLQRSIGIQHQPAGFTDPNLIHIFHRRHLHVLLKKAAKMRFTQATDSSQISCMKRLSVVLFHISQSRLHLPDLFFPEIFPDDRKSFI